MAYLIDTSVFVTAKNDYYAFDFCPCYWEWLIREHEAGNVFSIEQVFREVLKEDDELKDWAVQRGEEFFLPPDTKTIIAYGKVNNYVWSMPLPSDTTKRAFMGGADPLLIAHALAHGHIVVTHERLDGAGSKQIKIPNVCQNFSVLCEPPFDMMRKLGARFSLAPKAPPQETNNSDNK